MTYPGNHDFKARQGMTFAPQLTWAIDGTAVNLTGYTARMQVRPTVDSTAVPINLTSGSGITLGGTAGTIQLSVAATALAAIEAGRYVYDLELQSGGGTVTTILAGYFDVSPEVTR